MVGQDETLRGGDKPHIDTVRHAHVGDGIEARDFPIGRRLQLAQRARVLGKLGVLDLQHRDGGGDVTGKFFFDPGIKRFVLIGPLGPAAFTLDDAPVAERFSARHDG